MPNNDQRKMIRVDFKAQIILEADSVKVQVEGSSKDLIVDDFSTMLEYAEDVRTGSFKSRSGR